MFCGDTRNIFPLKAIVGLSQQMGNQTQFNCRLKRQKSIQTNVYKGQSCQQKFIDVLQCLVQALLFIALFLSLQEGISQVHIQKINRTTTSQIPLFPSNQQLLFGTCCFHQVRLWFNSKALIVSEENAAKATSSLIQLSAAKAVKPPELLPSKGR